jgi:hypothetical protein
MISKEARMPVSIPVFIPQYHTDKIGGEGVGVGIPLLPVLSIF